MPSLLAEANAICPACGLAFPVFIQDLKLLGMKDFVCSDFYSTEGTSEYPMTENCTAADEAWKANPTPDHVPCCHDVDLIRASFAMKVRLRQL